MTSGVRREDGGPRPAVDDQAAAAVPGRWGDDGEFSMFVAARWRALTHTAYLLTGDFHEAEDLVQATLARVYPHWRRIRQETAESYVRRCLVNTHRSRHRKRRIVHFLVPLLPDSASPAADADPSAAGEERDVLLRALADLPVRMRTVVVLRYWEDLSAEDVARALGCSVGTVKSQASRALVKLRDHPALAGHPLAGRLGESR